VSDHEPPEPTAFRQLDQLVRGLGEQLAVFRKRAHAAEAHVKALEAIAQPGNLFTEQRVRELEKEVEELKLRLGFAKQRTRVVLDQVRFLRQQQGLAASNGGPER
jgi:hypothetical protein